MLQYNQRENTFSLPALQHAKKIHNWGKLNTDLLREISSKSTHWPKIERCQISKFQVTIGQNISQLFQLQSEDFFCNIWIRNYGGEQTTFQAQDADLGNSI